jgi:23S rRNA (pseudouridine1915-N3)-methyltransferase
MSSAYIKDKEDELIRKSVASGDFLILLDEKGKTYNSVEFSDFIKKKINTGVKQIVFVIGGAFGFSDKLKAGANASVSLSKMTFSHQPVRLLFLEQLYRAFTIIKGEPYHNE